MAIIYALVARGQIVLAEHTDASGNFPTVTRAVLRKITENLSSDNLSTRSTFAYDDHHFHFVTHEELVYLCMAENETRSSVAFAMLDDMKQKFISKYGSERGKTAIAYAMNRKFAPEIQQRMEKYNAPNPVVDRFDEVQGKMDSVKSIMVENLKKVLEREEKLDILVDKTSHLQHEAIKFGDTATQLKRTMWWKNTKMWCLSITFLLVLIYIIISYKCGFTFESCSRHFEPKGIQAS